MIHQRVEMFHRHHLRWLALEIDCLGEAVADDIGRHDGILFGEEIDVLVPHVAGSADAVDHQKYRPVALIKPARPDAANFFDLTFHRHFPHRSRASVRPIIGQALS